MFETRALAIPAVLEVTPRRHRDDRGSLAVTFHAEAFAAIAPGLALLQENETVSPRAFTLRGLHFQAPPHAQAKLVRVLRGRILDVAVDIRSGSPSFGRSVSLELSAEAGNQMLVPAGFAHGFVTLEPDTTVLYKLSAPYAPAHDGAIRWDDPALGIDWRLNGRTPLLSPRDAHAPRLAEIETPFSPEAFA